MIHLVDFDGHVLLRHPQRSGFTMRVRDTGTMRHADVYLTGGEVAKALAHKAPAQALLRLVAPRLNLAFAELQAEMASADLATLQSFTEKVPDPEPESAP